jgi:hypothetical protein
MKPDTDSAAPQLQPGLLRLLLIILPGCLQAGTSKSISKLPVTVERSPANQVALFS